MSTLEEQVKEYEQAIEGLRDLILEVNKDKHDKRLSEMAKMLDLCLQEADAQRRLTDLLIGKIKQAGGDETYGRNGATLTESN